MFKSELTAAIILFVDSAGLDPFFFISNLLQRSKASQIFTECWQHCQAR